MCSKRLQTAKYIQLSTAPRLQKATYKNISHNATACIAAQEAYHATMKKAVFVLLLIGLTIGARAYNTASFYTVVEAYDGDTIAVRMHGKTEKIRLIGVDTPETKDPRKPVQCYGPEASDYSVLTLTGKKVRLVADPLSTNRDRYNRLLRYVYLEDGSLYNQQLIHGGYAKAYTGFPFSHSGAFSAVEQQAKATSAGMWGACTTEAGESSQVVEQ